MVSKKEKEERLFRQYEKAIEIRALEINLLWKRSLFFWGFIAIAFLVYFESLSLIKDNPSEINNLYPLIIACWGFLCSFVWVLVNFSSKYWQKAWEKVVDEFERGERGIKIEPLIKRSTNINEDIKWDDKWDWRFSLSRLAIWMSVLTTILWLVLIFKSIIFLICNFVIFYNGFYKLFIISIIAIILLIVTLLLAYFIVHSTLRLKKRRGKKS